MNSFAESQSGWLHCFSDTISVSDQNIRFKANKFSSKGIDHYVERHYLAWPTSNFKMDVINTFTVL